jgi:hypothetical protein
MSYPPTAEQFRKAAVLYKPTGEILTLEEALGRIWTDVYEKSQTDWEDIFNAPEQLRLLK